MALQICLLPPAVVAISTTLHPRTTIPGRTSRQVRWLNDSIFMPDEANAFLQSRGPLNRLGSFCLVD